MNNVSSLTDADLRALRMLASENRIVGPGYLGDLLWRRTDRGGSNCSCPYARQAGKVCNRLKAAGLAEWVHEGEFWGWRATAAGKRRAAEDPRPAYGTE